MLTGKPDDPKMRESASIWLIEENGEFAFPSASFDEQTDASAQFLSWVRTRDHLIACQRKSNISIHHPTSSVCNDLLRPAVALKCLFHECQSRRFAAPVRDEAFQDLSLVIDSAPLIFTNILSRCQRRRPAIRPKPASRARRVSNRISTRSTRRTRLVQPTSRARHR